MQEELEHYFLQQQNVQKQLTSAEERWQRTIQRNPDFCDFESIEVLAAESSESMATRWRLKNLNAAGRSHPELEFRTIIEHGIAGFVLSREPGTTGPLSRWPSSAADQNELMLLPAGTRTNFPQRIENLLDLGTRDWDLLQTLARLLANVLKTPAALKTPADFQPALLRNGLDKLRQIFEKFPATLRYDSVSLKREQVNPDYEHLWLRVENLAFGDKRWPEFEFRLSCANVRPNRFGTHPKLEFPEESSQAAFDAWFIESYDDFGAKLELRFALPESMDLAVWQRLPENDRAFLSALIKRLPAMLGALQGAGAQLKRPWGDWKNMALEIQRVLASHTAPPPAPALPTPMQAAVTGAAPLTEPTPAPPSAVKTAENPSTKTASKTKAPKRVPTPKTQEAQK
ncbi:MAG: hypothetical protein FD118_4114 [Rhodocyclaceae bacterium]|nr:MAG: hypothetical protein FD118_4114 [Rhodocyclaceae bacterium]